MRIALALSGGGSTKVADGAAQAGLISAFNSLLRDPEFGSYGFWTDYPLQKAVPPLLATPPGDLSHEEVLKLNRELLESVFSEEFEVRHIPLDSIVLSDAGAPFDWQTHRFEGLTRIRCFACVFEGAAAPGIDSTLGYPETEVGLVLKETRGDSGGRRAPRGGLA